MPSSLAEILRDHSKRLEAVLGPDASSARIEVQCLLQAVLQVKRAYLLTHPEQILDAGQQASYTALFARRLKGEPLAYILGAREFYGLNFRVTPATLIPRPDTELLVELALQRVPLTPDETTEETTSQSTKLQKSQQVTGYSHSTRPLKDDSQVAGYPNLPLSGEEHACRVLDLGTGSGAIALAIAQARPDSEVTAVDASPEALEVARDNARRLHLANVRLLASDWFAALAGERYDLIVSNPPYIAAGDAHLAQGDLRFEPRSALASGTDGLDDIRHIVATAKDHLNPGGWLLFEHGHDQAERARTLLQQSGYAGVFSAHDLAGIERVSGGTIS